MNILGINFTKVLAERIQEVKQSSINTNIEFTDVQKEKLEIFKEVEAVRINYTFSITYNQGEGKKQEKVAEIVIEGTILLSATPEESKDLFKAWKKEELPSQFKIPLFNVLLKKCSVKALSLEEDLGIPLHVPFPKIQPKPQE